MPMFSSENLKMVGGVIAAVAGIFAIAAGYVGAGGPIIATRQWVLIQSDNLKGRLIDNSIQTNNLQLDLLRREKTDREIQVQKETNQEVRSLYQNRLDAVTDSIASTIRRNMELDHEKATISQGHDH